jgi:hypothetical protein
LPNVNLPAATRRGAVPLVTGGGNDPPSFVDDVERRGISGTGVPTTVRKSEESNKRLTRCQLSMTHVRQILAIHNLTS